LDALIEFNWKLMNCSAWLEMSLKTNSYEEKHIKIHSWVFGDCIGY
jgi:hypothetical protein